MSQEPGQEPQVRLEAPGDTETDEGTKPMRTGTPKPGNDGFAGKRAGRRALLIGVAAMIATLLGAYTGLIVGIGALYVGIRTHRASRRAQSPAPGAVLGIVLSSIALVISLGAVGLQVFLWNEIQTYSKCVASSNTITDQDLCRDAFNRGVERKLHLPKGSAVNVGYL